MKKRRFLSLILFVFCLCLTGTNVFSVQAGEISEEYEIDDAMRKFMQENDLPEIATPINCELELIYRQIGEDNKGFSFTGPNDLLKDSYGFSGNVIAYKSGESIHLYLDICFEETADIFENDILSIYCPEGIYPCDLPAQILSINNSEEWYVENSGVAWMSDGSGYVFGLNEIAQKREMSRILLYINDTTSTDSGSVLQNMTVNWWHYVSENEPIIESVLSSSNTKADTNSFPWKAILIVLLIDLDIVAVIIIIRHILKKRRIKQESPEQQAAIADEAEAELQQNLKLKPEDVEYLKEIGYFDPNKK